MNNENRNRSALELMQIALRCYAADGGFRLRANERPSLPPSLWTVVFDTETEADAAQNLRFGTYQVRYGGELREKGIFLNPYSLTPSESSLVQSVATAMDMKIRTVPDFVENVFSKCGYDWDGNIVGFNIPYDISRIAIGHGSARGSMRGGFTFIISPDPWRPRIQVKHLNARAALMNFTLPGKQRAGRGTRRRRNRVQERRGHFVDLKTLAWLIHRRAGIRWRM